MTTSEAASVWMGISNEGKIASQFLCVACFKYGWALDGAGTPTGHS